MNIRHLGPDSEVIVKKASTVPDEASRLTPRVRIHHGVVPTERLKTTKPEANVIAGIGVLENKSSLDELTVIFNCDFAYLRAGDKVYVKQNQYNAMWASQVYHLEDKEFILVPVDAIVASKKF